MKIKRTTAFQFFLIAGHLIAALMGCSPRKEDLGDVIIEGVLAPPSNQTSCQYQGDLAQAKLLQMGTIDLALTMTYAPYIRIQNTLKEQEGDTESANAVIEGVHVIVQDDKGNELDTFKAPIMTENPVLQGGGDYAALLINLINAKNLLTFLKDVTAAKAKIITLQFFLYGRTDAGLPIQTKPFEFKVRACMACLVNYPTDSIDLSKKQSDGKPNCENRAVVPPAPCLIGQDDSIDCRACPDKLACNPAVSHTLTFSTVNQMPPTAGP